MRTFMPLKAIIAAKLPASLALRLGPYSTTDGSTRGAAVITILPPNVSTKSSSVRQTISTAYGTNSFLGHDKPHAACTHLLLLPKKLGTKAVSSYETELCAVLRDLLNRYGILSFGITWIDNQSVLLLAAAAATAETSCYRIEIRNGNRFLHRLLRTLNEQVTIKNTD
jgi:hypothetical protein